MLAPLSRCFNPSSLPFSQKFPLEFGQPSHHGEYETSGWRAGVDAKIENAEVNAPPMQVFDQQENIRRGSAEATNFRDRERVAKREAFNQLIEKRSHPDPGNFLDHNPGRTGAAKGIDLSILRLVGRRDAGIPDEIGGSGTIHPATLFCHLPFVTNKVKPECCLMNSGEMYTLLRF